VPHASLHMVARSTTPAHDMLSLSRAQESDPVAIKTLYNTSLSVFGLPNPANVSESAQQ
jgi:hypothetical protein